MKNALVTLSFRIDLPESTVALIANDADYAEALRRIEDAVLADPPYFLQFAGEPEIEVTA